MPTSWYQATSVLLEKIMMERPSSVLDVGVGFGKYGVLLREALDIPYERYDKRQWAARIDGIEAFRGYRNPLHEYVYDNVTYKPVSECLDGLGIYDVVLMIDILEHFTKEQGMELLERLLIHTRKALIISTPINPEPQEEYIGNSFEAHLSRWTPVDFARFEADFITLPVSDNQALIVKLYPIQNNRNDSPQRLYDTRLISLIKPVREDNEKLHIAYALPHQWLTGGLKMLVEQLRWLKARGHTVDAYLRGSDASASALPDWMPTEVDSDTVIHGGELFHKHIRPCDVIISGWYDQIPDLLMARIPVLYWEQGSEPLFGDYRGAQFTETQRNSQRALYSLPVALASVSDFVADVMDKRYNRKTAVIPNGVDTDFFCPFPTRNREPVILLVGNPYLPFKRFPTALAVLGRVWNAGRKFRVRWICQYQPDIRNSPFPVEAVCNPPQENLAQLYGSADILLFPSIYEGFGMPPLEAMASGLAVVCADCGGVAMYAMHEHNAFIVQPEDKNAMFTALIRLIDDEALRRKLSANARETALRFSMDKSFSKLEALLYAIKEQGNPAFSSN